jgi:hypothetical protein
MNDPSAQASRPWRSRVVVSEDGDHLQLICPPRRFRESLRALFGLTSLAFVAGIFASMYSQGILPVVTLILCPSCLPGIGILVWFFAAGRSCTRMTVANRRLVVDVSRTLRPRHWEWGLHQVTLIQVQHGLYRAKLRIASAEGSREVLSNRDAQEVDWIAPLLQRAVAANDGAVPAEIPARPGEVEAALTSQAEQPATRGYFRAGPGALAVRFSFLEAPLHEFFAAPTWNLSVWWRSRLGQAVPLGTADISCRVDEDGTAFLEIAGTSRPKVSLFLWCDDKEALQTALARFWGAKE